MQQAYGSGPSTSGPGPLMRRSISPVPVQTLSNGSGPSMPMGIGPAPMPPGFAGSKANGWVGVGQPGPNSIPAGMKEPRRPSSVAEGRERDKERERYMEGARARDRAEREREFERDRDQERAYHMQNAQMMQQRHQGQQHSHPHGHSTSGQVAHHHVGPHHHHHHHHHVHHHHHPQHPNGPSNLSNGGQGPPMSSMSTSSTAGPNSMGSPPTPRDLEPRRLHPSAEVVEMASDTSRQAGPSQHMWKSNDGLPLVDIRDRGKQPLGPPVGPHERLMTPFGTPAQAGPSTFPGSPRNVHGPPVAPASAVSSRRGSFSIAEENGFPRPVSSSSQGHPPPSHPSGSAHRVSIPRRPRTPNAQSHANSWGSPPHAVEFGLPTGSPRSNGMPARTKSPSSVSSGLPQSFLGPMRSPTRPSQQTLNVPQLPPPPPLTSMGHLSSPVRPTTPTRNGASMKPFGRTPPSPGQMKPSATHPPSASLHALEQHVNGAAGISLSSTQPSNVVNIRTSSPLFPPSHGGQSHPPRLSSAGMSDVSIPNGPAGPKIVPVDGS